MEQQGPDLPSHLKQLKRTDAIYSTVVCQDTTSDSEGQWLPREDKQRGEPRDCPRAQPEEFPGSDARGAQVEPGGSPVVGETVLEVQKSQDDESSEGRIPKWRDPQREDTPGMCRECLQVFGWEDVSTSMWGDYPGVGQEPPNKNKDSHSRAHTGPLSVPVRLS